MQHGKDKATRNRDFAGLPTDSLRVLQFTDTHFYANPEKKLLGLKTYYSFLRVLQQAREQHWPADLILATGDLVHDNSEAGYRAFRKHFESLNVPVYALPGNHDDPATLRQVLKGGNVMAAQSACKGYWQFILLNSTMPGWDGGHLDERELGLLEQCLKLYPHHHALVCLHHPPVPIHSRWMDRIGLDNPDAFFAVLDRFHQVRGVLWGHIHQEFIQERGGVKLMGAPSTCFQFKPGEDEFSVDNRPPGYRWLALHPDGTIDTGVSYLEHVPTEVDMSSAGY
jgi:Predicted phosphohydrolases